MIDIINEIFRDVQSLDLLPTEHNVALLADSYNKIKDLAQLIVDMQRQIQTSGGEADG